MAIPVVPQDSSSYNTTNTNYPAGHSPDSGGIVTTPPPGGTAQKLVSGTSNPATVAGTGVPFIWEPVNYTPPKLAVSDNFPGTLLSSSWTMVLNGHGDTTGFTISNGLVRDLDTGLQYGCVAYWNKNSSFPADQYSQVALTLDHTQNGGAGPAVRVQASGACYFLLCYYNNTVTYLFRMSDNFNATQLATVATPKFTVDGTVAKIRVSGSSIIGSINGVDFISATDTTLASGQPGIYGDNGNPTTGMGLWSAGQL